MKQLITHSTYLHDNHTLITAITELEKHSLHNSSKCLIKNNHFGTTAGCYIQSLMLRSQAIIASTIIRLDISHASTTKSVTRQNEKRMIYISVDSIYIHINTYVDRKNEVFTARSLLHCDDDVKYATKHPDDENH